MKRATRTLPGSTSCPLLFPRRAFCMSFSGVSVNICFTFAAISKAVQPLLLTSSIIVSVSANIYKRKKTVLRWKLLLSAKSCFFILFFFLFLFFVTNYSLVTYNWLIGTFSFNRSENDKWRQLKWILKSKRKWVLAWLQAKCFYSFLVILLSNNYLQLTPARAINGNFIWVDLFKYVICAQPQSDQNISD